MQGFVAVAVIGAVVAITVWMVRVMVREVRAARTSTDQFAGLAEMSKSKLGGLLVVVPMLVLVWIGLPSWVSVAWLIAASLVLTSLLIRERRRLRAQS